MSNSEVSTYGSIFWERLNSLFSNGSGREDDNEEQPRHRGVLIGMCVFFSVLLWFFSSMGESYTRLIRLDAAVENTSENQAFLSLPPDKILAQVTGDGVQLMQLYYNPPRIVISAVEGRVNFREAVARQLPQGVVLEQVIPSDFVLNTEERIQKKIPVRLRASLSWPLTYELTRPATVFPDSIEVTGAKSIVESLTDWPTVHFEEEDLKDTLSVTLALVDSLAGLVQFVDEEVQLTAIVEEFTEGSREVDIMVQEVSAMHETIALDPPVIEVLFRVPLSQYQTAMSARDFFASVSYEELLADTAGVIVPKLELPEGILFVDVYLNPGEVRYFNLLNDE